MAKLTVEASSPNNSLLGNCTSPCTVKSEPAQGSANTSSLHPCPQCGSKKIWRDGSRYSIFGDKIQRWLCRDCGFLFSDAEDLQKAKNAVESVETMDTKSLKTPNDKVTASQICVMETKNLDAEQQTTQVPRRNDPESRGKIIEHGFWM